MCFGPTNNKNYTQKVNKKQKKLALFHAVAEKAANDALMVVDSVVIESGKTKDAAAFVKSLGQRDVLVVKELIDEKTFYAFRNLKNAYLVDGQEVNAYLISAFDAVVIEENLFLIWLEV